MMKTVLPGARSHRIFIISAVVFCAALMIVVDGVIMPPYFVKSAIKLVLFSGAMAAYLLLSGEKSALRLLRPTRKGALVALALGGAVYAVVLGGYFALRGVFDFSGITASLTGNIGVTADNFIFVSLYISFVNSLLEEALFRGLGFMILRRYTSDTVALLFSSVCFAVYHAGITNGWFSLGLYLLTLVGLIAAGVMFDLLDRKSDGLFVSWIVHMFANFAINTVGFILFAQAG